MTFAIVRDRVILDHAQHDSLWSLQRWVEAAGRRAKGRVMLLDLEPGQSARVGARVTVSELHLDFAELEAPTVSTQRGGTGGPPRMTHSSRRASVPSCATGA